MIQLREKVRIFVFTFIIAVLFALVTGCWNTEAGRIWQTDSEDLIWGRILQMQQGEQGGGGFLGVYLPQGVFGYLKESFLQGSVEGEWLPYTHQSGLQGTVYGGINLLAKIVLPQPKIRWAMLRFGNSILYIMEMLWLCRWLYKKTGFAAAIVAFSCVLFAGFSLMSMANLYWVNWTLLLPFLVSTAVCDWIAKEKRHVVIGALLIGLATLLKSLCGFEFISSVMIAAELPVIFNLLTSERQDRRFWMQCFGIVALFQLLAFAIAFGIWLLQDYLYLQSWELMKEDVLATISKRTGLFEEWVPTDNAAYAASLQDPRLNVLKFYLTQPVYFNMFSMVHLIVAALLSYGLLLLYAGIYRNHASLAKVKLKQQGKWVIFAFISVLAPASWHILASGHSSIHTHINGMLWLFPTMPVLLAVIASNIVTLDGLLRGNQHDLG